MFGSLRFRELGSCVAVASLLALSSTEVHAGQDRARIYTSPQADAILVDFQMTYAYPPTNAEVEEMEHIIQGASRILCDATDGQLRLGTVWLTAGSAGKAAADVFIMPPGLWNRSSSSGFILHDAARIFLSQGGQTMYTLAHELVHAVFRLRDEYGEQNRYGRYDGFGHAIEPGRCTYTQTRCWSDDNCEGAETCDDGLITGQVNTVMGPRLGIHHCETADTTPCASDFDCPQADVCPPHPFYSEFSTAANYDSVTGDGVLCPENRPGEIIALVGGIGAQPDDVTEDATPFSSVSWEAIGDTATYWITLELIDSAGIVTRANEESSHDIHVIFKHLDRTEKEWEIHFVIAAKHLEEPPQELGDEDPFEFASQIIDFNGGSTTYLPENFFPAFIAQGNLDPVVIPKLASTEATATLELDIGELLLIEPADGHRLDARSAILADDHLAQRGNCTASAAAIGGLSEEWCGICADVYNTSTDRWEAAAITIATLLDRPANTLGDSE